ncbi:TIR-like protein FxsC [Kitasatospora sp. NBC_00240]|uniref:TIR-like protein FxsC n=1 Tax=Kitasatospora sp. NBC_00240 TaxID=2903567 RepID=UPI0022555EAF|nr:TIR-like protein FxsC [Kitasatospora sp. NBC_00240]MCX5211263.1 TIR-like protein FxsC [Kitasatospora sp. NBC_00240]
MRPYFFFSYARRDHETGRAFVDQFFTDLRDELARIEPAAGPGELAYRDTESLRLGDDWERQLSRMLGASRAMVALYSPEYFASLYCGKEWTAFHDRMRRHEDESGESVPALIPVLWAPPPEGLPPEVKKIQYVQRDMGETYARAGLRDLLRTDPHGPEYTRVVQVVAERVRDVAGRPVGESRELDLATVRGCFPASAPVAGAPATTGLVRLFVAAGRAGQDVPAPPDDGPRGGWYGARPWDWAPYHPPTRPSLVVRAQRAITQAGHSTTLDEIGPDLGARLDRAREDNQVSVLLVDPWAAGAGAYRQTLSHFDGRNHPVTGVLVPTGTDDPPEGPAYTRLWAGVRQVFPRNWLHRTGPEPLFRVRVSRERFEDELLTMVTVAQNKLLDDEATDPAGVRAAFGLGPGGPAMPGLAAAAWPPADRAAAPAGPSHEGDTER